jgi:hypothetical protein
MALRVDSASNRNEYKDYFLRWADNFNTFMFRLSQNLGASNSWNPLGLSRPIMELLLHVGLIHSLNYNCNFAYRQF